MVFGSAADGTSRRWRITARNTSVDGKRAREVSRDAGNLDQRGSAEFHGEFVNFDPIWCSPKPVQNGGPPVLLGSQSKKVFERVADYCDGWLPINNPAQRLARADQNLREHEKQRGRGQLSLSLFGAPPKEEPLHQLIELGFERLLFPLPPAPRETVMPMIDNYAKIAAKMR